MQPSLGKVNLSFPTASQRLAFLTSVTLEVDGTLIHELLEQLLLFMKT